jgi:hypothetical protein
MSDDEEEESLPPEWLDAVCKDCKDAVLAHIGESFQPVAEPLSELGEGLSAELMHADRLLGDRGLSGQSRGASPP